MKACSRRSAKSASWARANVSTAFATSGDTAYVVTFRQTDPLYTIDLSNPEAPKVLGELKILGYSAYLHPIDDGLLLGIGQDADEQGRTKGTQVAVFDVSDPANPKANPHDDRSTTDGRRSSTTTGPSSTGRPPG